jgi:hypothetical protein
MEPEGRDQKEADLKESLAAAWDQWSNVEDPSILDEASLIAILRETCIDPLWAVWYNANKNISNEHSLTPNEQAAAAAFMFFFLLWARDTAKRWKSRVDDYRTQRTESQQRGPLPTPTRPAGAPPPGTQPLPPGASPAQPGPPVPPPWSQARNEIVTEADVERVAVTSVTTTHSDGELSGAATVRAGGQALIGVWRCEPKACPKCETLNGTRENRWRLDSQSGPPLHPNCRCWIEWVPWERS